MNNDTESNVYLGEKTNDIGYLGSGNSPRGRSRQNLVMIPRAFSIHNHVYLVPLEPLVNICIELIKSVTS